ncbi:hypothetical protein Tsubulata_042992 [Turnera subulata]|uniref:DUF4283 domain-containing protein n=1 Tax=Turnera subulata TaxID=218843 RepID=A0A9Q0GIS5_9ROSI|nr:hypothetical protein Tsubulata_042992 [Turnera subulata]
MLQGYGWFFGFRWGSGATIVAFDLGLGWAVGKLGLSEVDGLAGFADEREAVGLGDTPFHGDFDTVNRDSWARIVSNDSNVTPQPLEFVKPMLAADNSTICIPSELLDIGRKKYSLCLVGQFMGVMPKMGFIHAIFNKLWGRQGPISVSPYKEDLILVQFPIESALLRALSGGPWHVGGIPLVLRRYSSRCFSFCYFESSCFSFSHSNF